jgi:hypothetical protein
MQRSAGTKREDRDMAKTEGTERVLATGLYPNTEAWEAVDADATFFLPTWELAEGDEALAFYFRTSGRIWTPWRPTERV